MYKRQKYFKDGKKQLSNVKDYNSQNTEQKDVKGIVELLMKLDFIRQEIKK